MAKPRTEAEFGQQVLAFLRARGWRCYSEVELVYGSTTDIVAIRDRRVRLIELKLTLSPQLVRQLYVKYNYLSQHRGVKHCGIVPLRQTGSNVDDICGQRYFVYDGATCWRLGMQPHPTKQWHSAALWVESEDICRPARTKPTDERNYEPGEPADRRFLDFFEGMPETDGAGTPSGSKTIGIYDLVCNWARRNQNKLAGLQPDEAAHLIRMWLPGVPNSYGTSMLLRAIEGTEPRPESWPKTRERAIGV